VHDHCVDRIMSHNVIDSRVKVMWELMYVGLVSVRVSLLSSNCSFRHVNTASNARVTCAGVSGVQNLSLFNESCNIFGEGRVRF
jgi:hypothetical protein